MLIKQDATDTISDAMMSYSASVLLDRALPVLQDGLKPVQRRIMFIYYLDKIDKLTKSATVAGRVMRVHPHGSAYGAMVGMAQEDKNQVPLILGHGNWGQYTSADLDAAADRYTETKISDFGKEMTSRIKDKVVKSIPNYDGSIQMPEVLPVTFPTILMYYQQGIGVGYASEILPFNMKEIAKAIKEYVAAGSFEPIYPDFPTKGFLVKNHEQVSGIANIGRGGLTVRAKISKVDATTLSITEIPFGTKREQIISKVIQLAKTERLKEIRNVVDLTDFHGLNIEIEARKNTNLDILIAKLYRFTPLESKVNSNSNIIDIEDGTPSVMGTKEIIDRWLKWRLETYKTGLFNEIESLENDLHLLKGLKKVLLNVDDVVEIIRHSKKDLIVNKLSEAFDLDELQSKYVMNLKLYNINNDYIEVKIEDIKKFEDEVISKKTLLSDDKQIKSNIVEEIEILSDKYGVDRQTLLVEDTQESIEIKKIAIEETDTNNYFVGLTKDGYGIKTSTKEELKNQELKPGDKINTIFELNGADSIGVVASDNILYGIKVSDIKSQGTQYGVFLKQLNPYEFDDIIGYVPISENYSHVVYGYSNSKINMWPMENLSKNKKKTKNAYNLDNGIPLFIGYVKKGTTPLVVVKDASKSAIIKFDDIPATAHRAAKGNFTLPTKNATQIIQK